MMGPVLLCSVLLTSSTSDGESWPQWRGPDASGVAAGNPPVRWDEDTNVRFKVELPGFGGSTPIVWEDQIFLLSAIRTERKSETGPASNEGRRTEAPDVYYQLVVMSLERDTGEARWETMLRETVPHEGHHDTHGYASSSPVTDGEHLYVSFGSHGLYCLDLEGEVLWERDLGDMHTRKGWGEAASPVVAGDTLLFAWDHEGDSFLIAMDKQSGETVWRQDRDEPSTWTTPVLHSDGQRTQVIVQGTQRVRSYDLASGDVLWACGGQTVNAIPLPVIGGGHVFCMSGYRGSIAVAIPLDASGDITDTEGVAWRHSGGTPYVPSPLYLDGRLYFLDGNRAMLSCLDAATGKVLIERQRLPDLGNIYASLVSAQGRLYVSDREGTTLVLKPGDTEFQVIATNRLDDGFNASPVIVGDEILLRGRSLYCIGE